MKNIVWIVLFSLFSLLPILIIAKILALTHDNKSLEIKKPFNHYERGPIFDRKGNILAMQINSWNLGLRLIDTDNPSEVIQNLSSILDIPVSALEEKLADPAKYVRIKKHISRKEYEEISKLKKDGKLNGVQFNEISWRRYPGNESLAYLIGYYGEDGIGLDGIEANFNKDLQARIDKPMGNSIYLTIDSILQSSIEEIVYETLIESKSSFINTILMDGRTGEILAYVSLPSFNLNNYYTYSQEELTNKPIHYNYEPGSVFKVFSIASLLNQGSININSVFDASSAYIDAEHGFIIQDIWYPGIISSSEIIKYSSNVGISHAIERISDVTFYQHLHNFGFGQKTGINLPGESRGILKKPQQWSARTKPTIALGQEIAVTAMQIVTAATVFVNDGYLIKPQVIKKITKPDGSTVHSSTTEKKRQVLNPGISKQVLRMMNEATNPEGTARRLKIDGINISAKTGTAQVFDISENKYSKDNFIASTLSILPTEDPRLIIYAAIHNPKSGEIYGGRTTAPMIRKMLKFILPYLGYLGSGRVAEAINAKSHNNQEKTNTKFQIHKYYENYIGMSKREIWPLFVNSNVNLKLYGSGSVASQIPRPGTEVAGNATLILNFQ